MTTTVPSNDNAPSADSTPLLEARHLVQEFVLYDRGGTRGGVVSAVADVSFEVRQGETLGVVGETGSGKSTLARCVLAAPKPKSGEVLFGGTNILELGSSQLREVRRNMQLVFQDPFGSLDPKWRVFDIVEEPLLEHKAGNSEARRRRVNELLELVGLDPAVHGTRRPRELSGGQCQRVAIARALTLAPSLIICDEAVSSLDVLVQAQILNLFEELRTSLKLSYLFIAHDLALVKQVSDRVAVMYLGKLMEVGRANDIYRQPFHPYTSALLASIPSYEPSDRRTRVGHVIEGEPPSAFEPPSGCRFRTRCPLAQERCALEEPPMRVLGPDRTRWRVTSRWQVSPTLRRIWRLPPEPKPGPSRLA